MAFFQLIMWPTDLPNILLHVSPYVRQWVNTASQCFHELDYFNLLQSTVRNKIDFHSLLGGIMSHIIADACNKYMVSNIGTIQGHFMRIIFLILSKSTLNNNLPHIFFIVKNSRFLFLNFCTSLANMLAKMVHKMPINLMELKYWYEFKVSYALYIWNLISNVMKIPTHALKIIVKFEN